MKRNTQIIGSILITFTLMFITSFGLDLEIVKTSIVRSILIYFLIIIEAITGFLIFKQYVLEK